MKRSRTYKELKYLIRRLAKDRVVAALSAVSSLPIFVLLLIIIFITWQGLTAFRMLGLEMFGFRWDAEYGYFGATPLIFGSITVVAGALLIAIPIGVLSAIFLAEYAPHWLRDVVKPMVELLAAIPSIIYGVFALVFVAPIIKEVFSLPSGLVALTSSMILSIMTLPTIVSISSETISAVPKEYRRASIALGATHWQTVKGVVIPTAAPGIVASIILGFGRAIGETVAVALAIGARAKVSWSLLEPMHALTAAIIYVFPEAAYGEMSWYVCFGLGVILFAITFAVNTVAGFILRKVPKGVVQL